MVNLYREYRYPGDPVVTIKSEYLWCDDARAAIMEAAMALNGVTRLRDDELIRSIMYSFECLGDYIKEFDDKWQRGHNSNSIYKCKLYISTEWSDYGLPYVVRMAINDEWYGDWIDGRRWWCGREEIDRTLDDWHHKEMEAYEG